MPNLLKFKMSQFLYADNFDKLKMYLIPEENKIIIKNNEDFSLMYEVFMVILKLEGMVPFYNYIISIYEELENNKSDTQGNVYKSWIENTKEYHEKIISNIIENIQIIFEEINKKNSDFKRFTSLYIQSIENYKNSFGEIIETKNKNLLSAIELMKKTFCEIVEKVNII